MKIKKGIALKNYTTMKIGGKANFFAEVVSVKELKEAIAFAKENNLPVAILGSGSNVLFSNGEFRGLIIKNEIKGIEWKESKSQKIIVIASAGEDWDDFVALTVKKGFWGLENLSGIPGTVGAAPIQNIGAYGTEIKDVLEWVLVFDAETGELKKMKNDGCEFNYRDSIFKHKEGKNYIVTKAAFRLSKKSRPKLEYKDLKEIFNFSAEGGSASPGQFSIHNGEKQRREILKITPSQIREAVLKIRAKKFPDLKQFGTAGSFFKNPIVSREVFDALKKRYPDLPGFELRFDLGSGKRSNLVKISLAWILDKICGLRGYSKGNVALFERQPIVLVQNGKATSEEIEAFAREVAGIVKEKTGIEIEWEVRKI